MTLEGSPKLSHLFCKCRVNTEGITLYPPDMEYKPELTRDKGHSARVTRQPAGLKERHEFGEEIYIDDPPVLQGVDKSRGALACSPAVPKSASFFSCTEYSSLVQNLAKGPANIGVCLNHPP